MTHDDDQDEPATASGPKTAKRGAGRPRNPTAPRNAAQARLAVAVEAAEAERDAAALAYATDPSVAAELRMLRAMFAVAVAWGAYCRAQAIMTHALKYDEVAIKFAARLAALRELEGIDRLTALEARSRREDGIGKGS